MHEHFTKLRQNLELNQTLDELVQARHAAVRRAVPGKESKLIGSFQRKTKIQPRPEDELDVDILIVLGEFHRWVETGGVSPDAALYDLHNRVLESDRYSKKSPQADAPTITLHFADNVTSELTPAYIDNIGHDPAGIVHTPKGRAYWIPKNGHWELADYDFDANYITQRNRESDNHLVPTIKMLKAIKRFHFPELKSFALEILAAQTIPVITSYYKSHGLAITYPELVRHFFFLAKNDLGEPIRIPGSHSPAIVLDTFQTAEFAKWFDAIKNHLDQTLALPEMRQITKWRELFGDSFPATL